MSRYWSRLLFRLRWRRRRRARAAAAQAAVEIAFAAVVMIDDRGIIQAFNSQAEQLFGYRAGEVIGRNVSLLMPPADAESHDRYLSRFRQTREPRILSTVREVSLQRRDGRAFPAELAVHEFRADRRLFAGVVRDITARKEMEAALRQSEHRYRSIIAALAEGVVVHAPNGAVLSANESAQRLLGRSLDDLRGHTWRELPWRLITWDGNTLDPADHPVTVAVRTGKAVSGVLLGLEGHDGTRWLSMNARPVFTNDDGKVEAIIALFADVTGSARLIEKAALEWRRTFDLVDLPILILDRTGAAVRVNRAAVTLAGRSHEQLIGAQLGALGLGEPWVTARRVLDAARTSRAYQTMQVRDERSGRTWDVCVAPAKPPEGNDEMVTVMIHDRTATARLEESVQQSEKMAAMGALVAGVAHEVRNPLFGVLATLDALELQPGVRKGYERFLRALRHDAGRLAVLMRDLMEYGRPVERARHPVALRAVVERAVDACTSLAREHSVHLNNRVPGDLPPVAADASRLGDAFRNLIENAILHAPRDTAVVVEATEYRLETERGIECRVLDSGTGFVPEHLPRVFEPFFTGRRGGTGLGLAIVQGVVERHGGTVLAANRPDGGAVVTIRLPL